MNRMILCLLLVATVLLAACGGGAGDDPRAPGPGGLLGAHPAGLALFTAEQANDLQPLVLERSTAQFGEATFTALRDSITGHYPDVVFLYDAADLSPNLYAYRSEGQQIVLVTGGLMGLQGLSREGIALAMAFGIASFHQEPKTETGFPTIGSTDYFAFGTAARKIYPWSEWQNFVLAAFDQWKAMFSSISSEHAGADPTDPLAQPSLGCRVKAITAGVAGGPLPACVTGVLPWGPVTLAPVGARIYRSEQAVPASCTSDRTSPCWMLAMQDGTVQLLGSETIAGNDGGLQVIAFYRTA